MILLVWQRDSMTFRTEIDYKEGEQLYNLTTPSDLLYTTYHAVNTYGRTHGKS